MKYKIEAIDPLSHDRFYRLTLWEGDTVLAEHENKDYNILSLWVKKHYSLATLAKN